MRPADADQGLCIADRLNDADILVTPLSLLVAPIYNVIKGTYPLLEQLHQPPTHHIQVVSHHYNQSKMRTFSIIALLASFAAANPVPPETDTIPNVSFGVVNEAATARIVRAFSLLLTSVIFYLTLNHIIAR